MEEIANKCSVYPRICAGWLCYKRVSILPLEQINKKTQKLTYAGGCAVPLTANTTYD